jgi:hypothetical protein
MDPLAPVRELPARLDAMQRELDAVRAENARLNARIAVLEDRLRANSSNSSKPPSSDGPAKAPPKDKSGKRRRGGQPGHPQHKRALLPADQVDHAHDVVPASVAVVAPTRDPNARQGAASPVRIQGIFVNFGDGSRAGRPELRDARTSHRVGVLIPLMATARTEASGAAATARATTVHP